MKFFWEVFVTLLVIMDPPVSARLAGRVLDFCVSDGQPKAEFTLRDKPPDN